MLYAGLDLSRKGLDFHLLDSDGGTVEAGARPPDADGLAGLTQRLSTTSPRQRRATGRTPPSSVTLPQGRSARSRLYSYLGLDRP
jgi:hypothetical protein